MSRKIRRKFTEGDIFEFGFEEKYKLTFLDHLLYDKASMHNI